MQDSARLPEKAASPSGEIMKRDFGKRLKVIHPQWE
jgi:hypothetical protein